MSEIKVTVVDAGAEDARDVSTGTKAWELFAETPEVIAARVGERLVDLAHELADGDRVEGVRIDEPDGRDILRHSTAHVLAQAVQELFPEAKLGIGPPVENGFYYDFDVAEPFVPEDLDKLETRMRKIIKEGQKFSRRPVSDDEARAELAEEPYKLELIGLKGGATDAAEGASVEVGAGELTIYDNLRRNGDLAWKDLCRGPHLPTTKRIPAFKLMRTAAAYWRGSEKNPQLQRVYGTAWESKEALEAHLHRLEEAERRDHRKLGRELDLFSFPDEIGSGLAGLPPQGRRVRRRWRTTRGSATRSRATSSSTARTSPRGSSSRPRATSLVRRRHVPAHAAGRGRGQARHRLLPEADELPDAQPDLQVAGAVLPGAPAAALRVRHGLPLREVRGGARDDAGARLHPGRLPTSYCTREQMKDELRSLLTFVLDLLRDFGLDDFYLELSTRDPEKFVGDDETWDEATRTLEEVGRGVRSGAGAGPGWGRVLRSQDLGAGQGRHRSHLADVDHPAATSTCPSVSSSSTSRPTARVSGR